MSLLQNSNAIPQLGGYNLTDSVRFRESASAYLSKTFSSASNRKTWTWSAWVKRGNFDASNRQSLVGVTSAASDSNWLVFGFDTSNKFFVTTYSAVTTTTAVYRDVSAWYHIVVAFDSTQSTGADRIKIYVNGVQQIHNSGWTPTLNTDYAINSAAEHRIGGNADNANQSFDGYMTEVNFVDGQALTPSDFGEYDDTTGVWKPKRYTGSYGTNGFYLDMSTSGSTVTDQSGNGNDWTANNMNLTTSTATTYDIMSDVPTLTDEDTGNFATLNPLSKGSANTISEANLTSYKGSAGWTSAFGTIGVSTGKWYWEVTLTTAGSINAGLGISSDPAAMANSYIGSTSTSWGYHGYNGTKWNNNSSSAYGATWANGDVISVALDLDVGTLTFYKNNSSQGTAFSSLPSNTYFPAASNEYVPYLSFNFGQRPFKYTPPTGHKKLNTYNLPDSTITDGSQYFDTKLWTGNGTSQTISGLEFAPDLVWGKSRSVTGNHVLVDSIRGDNTNLNTNLTNAESTGSSISNLVNGSFDVAGGGVNASSVTMVGWSWRGSDSTAVSNTDGTITSTVSANTTAGFSVVSYVSNGTNTGTVGHGLSQKPDIVIQKNRTNASDWLVQTQLIDGSNDYLLLNTTAAAATAANGANATTFGSWDRPSGNNMIAYCFAPVEGFSKFGKYTGNGSADGPFVYTGFRPAFVITKVATGSTVQGWLIRDSKRDPYNVSDTMIPANTSSGDINNAGSYGIDLLSNGFKVRGTDGGVNQSGGTLVYMAFAENPMKNSLAR